MRPVETSPLAEGRELKYSQFKQSEITTMSPLAEGRELKFDGLDVPREVVRVAPRGGA